MKMNLLLGKRFEGVLVAQPRRGIAVPDDDLVDKSRDRRVDHVRVEAGFFQAERLLLAAGPLQHKKRTTIQVEEALSQRR